MKYRYPYKVLLLPALLLTLCLSLSLVSILMTGITEGVATPETVIPALLTVGAWCACTVLAFRFRLPVFLWFTAIFWGVQALLILLAQTPLFSLAPLFFSIATMPIWSYSAAIVALAVQNTVAKSILIVLPAAVITFLSAYQLYRLRHPKKTAPHPPRKGI